MILNKETSSETTDTPPAYDEVVPTPPPIQSDGKASRMVDLARTGTSSPQRRSSNAAVGVSSLAPHSPWPALNKRWYSWFGESDSDRQVKETVQSLIRDVVKEPASLTAASVLQSCLEACQARGLSFATIMSQKFIEGHCPIYWAIVRRRRRRSCDEQSSSEVDLLDILLSMPMDIATRSEAYLACLLVSDQELFQKLRSIPGKGASGLSGIHELLLGENECKDEVQAFLGDPDAGEFRIIWKISQFQKRMRHIGSVSTEVVTRGRIWVLTFAVSPNDIPGIKGGTWVAAVSLLAPSPPSDIYGRFCIPYHTSLSLPPIDQLQDGAELGAGSARAKKTRISIPWPGPPGSKVAVKPPIVLRCATQMSEIEPIQLSSIGAGADIRKQIFHSRKAVIVPLESHENGRSLQFDGSSYITPARTLEVVFEGSLTKPKSPDCVIC